jgi:hypothetical protein
MLGMFGIVLQAPSKTVWDGVYTDDQATRGEKALSDNCEGCHMKSDFAGKDFLNMWNGQTAFALFDNIKTNMPMDSPGKLTKEAYADIVAFMFKSNSFPSGKDELPTDDAALKEIKIQPKGR